MDGFAGVLVVLALVAALLSGAYAAAALARINAAPVLVTAFTGGWPPAEHAVSRFHVRWYPATLLFLAFDMEMIFMYPWTLVISTVGRSAVIEMFAFLAVLMAGVAYAWREGALRWT
jgi:NADH-quinone oxidoreductase subunit A